MEILGAMLGFLMMIALFGVLWVLPVVAGVRCAKRNGISPHWMWFGIHPLGGWIALAIICRSGKVDKVEGLAVKWMSGKVGCQSCGKFNPMNSAFCSQCGTAVSKPICPRCESAETQFISRTGSYIAAGIGFWVAASCALNGVQQASVTGTGGGTTWGELLGVILVVPLFLIGTASFFAPLSQRTKRVRCSSCDTESPTTAIVALRQLDVKETA